MRFTINATEFVKKRRDRVLATILSFKEANVDQYLPKETSDALRRVILNNVNDLNDLVLDLLKAQTVDVEINQLYLEALTRIEGKLDSRSD